MNTTAKALATLSLIVFSAACRQGALSEDGSQSRLSSVTLGEFKPEGTPAWKSGQLKFKKLSDAQANVSLSFTVAQSTLDASVPYGTYELTLEYFEDEKAAKLLYKACNDAKTNKPVQHMIFEKAVSLKVEICDAQGNAIGSTTGVSNVSVTPVARKAETNPSPSPTPTPTPPATPTPTPPSQPVAMGDAAKGNTLLMANCLGCHSSSSAPILDKTKANEAALERARTISAHGPNLVSLITNNKADIMAALAGR